MTPTQASNQILTWRYAIESHLSCLSPVQRNLFVAPANPNDCLELIRQAQGRKKYDGFVVALRPLIEPLKRFEGSIDVLVQVQSGIASPIWGPLRMIVTLISDRLKTLQNLVVLLDRIVDPLKRFANYESLFKDNDLLQNAIVALYCDLLEFCSRVVRYYSRSSLLNVFSSFDKDLLEVSDSIRHHWTEIDIVANAANIEEAKSARDAENIQRQLDIHKDVNRWLSPSNTTDDLRKHLFDYMDGSCKWLIEDPTFQTTFCGTDPSILSVLARPGGGKTTAAAFLIKHLTESVSGAVLYFFCKASDSEKRTTLHILRSLLWQCLQYDGGLYSIIVQWYYRSGRSVADSQNDISAMLTACLQATTMPSIFMVIDALDECLDASDLLVTLSSALLASNRPMKLILLSRDGVHLPHMPQVRMETLYLTGDKCQASIECYVRQRLAQMPSLEGNSADAKIVQPITDAAGGLWIFTRLLLDEIHQASSMSDVQRQISGLPHGLRNLYSSILSTKEKSFNEVQLRMVQEIYLWMNKTEYMPEWLRWNGHNDVLEDDTVCTILGAVTGSNELFNPAKLVAQLASPLLEVQLTSSTFAVDQNGLPYDAATFAVDFFHQTAKQYLAWSSDAKLTELPQCLRPRRLAPLYRGVTATWYLSQSPDFTRNLQQLRERPRNGIFPAYVELVYGLWDALKLPHLRWDLDAEELAKAGVLCDQLFSFLTTDKCLRWIEAAIIINYAGRWNQLIENVEDVLEIASDSLSAAPAFQRFHGARRALMTDFIYALAATWPKNDLPQQIAAKADQMPPGFYQRPLARKIMNLATQYQWLLTPAYARSSNCFFLDGQSSSMVVA